VWRLLVSKHLKLATPAQVNYEMTYDETEEAHELLDAIEAHEARARKKAEEAAKAR
jgi:hypothetical protein